MELGLLEILVTALVSILSGGGLVVWYREYGEQKAQDGDHSLDVAGVFQQRLQRVEDRLDEQNKQIRHLQKRESRLVAEVRVLVTRIGTLLMRLSQHEDISESERQQYLELAVDLYAQPHAGDRQAGEEPLYDEQETSDQPVP